MAKKGVKQGKKPHKNKPTSKKYSKYTIGENGEIKRERFCPRCGPGIFLMNSQNRFYCGKCHYSEFQTSSDKKEKSEEKPVEAAQ